jgi:hypothetical protein
MNKPADSLLPFRIDIINLLMELRDRQTELERKGDTSLFPKIEEACRALHAAFEALDE